MCCWVLEYLRHSRVVVACRVGQEQHYFRHHQFRVFFKEMTMTFMFKTTYNALRSKWWKSDINQIWMLPSAKRLGPKALTKNVNGTPGSQPINSAWNWHKATCVCNHRQPAKWRNMKKWYYVKCDSNNSQITWQGNVHNEIACTDSQPNNLS